MSSICPRFTQNAWKKDLCSNCFKSKDEHKISILTVSITNETDSFKKLPPPVANCSQGIIKNVFNKTKKLNSVSFSKELTKIIGYGGESSDTHISDDEETDQTNKYNEDLTLTDDEEYHEIVRLTKTNTEFNMNNGNLLGDPKENIKKSFAVLRLGKPQIDSSGKKQTLKISVTPFGDTSSKITNSKAKFKLCSDEKECIKKNEQQAITINIKNDAAKKIISEDVAALPIKRVMEKSLFKETSQFIEKENQNEMDKKTQSKKNDKITFEITSSFSKFNPVITKDHVKQKIRVPPKCSDFTNNSSTTENKVSAYYDIIDITNSYDNISEKQDHSKDQVDKGGNVFGSINNDNIKNNVTTDDKQNQPVYYNSQYINKMLLANQTHAASCSLNESGFMRNESTSDGPIDKKFNSDDALDSTESSFDGSSDDETSFNMNRSESDSGIGISIGSNYQISMNTENLKKENCRNNSDYEILQIMGQNSADSKSGKVFVIEKSRELAGEPDGSANPDGDVETIPALPKLPPPIAINSRTSFLQGMQKNILGKKPEVSVKPPFSMVKTFVKHSPTNTEQQVITQLQKVIKQTSTNMTPEKLTLTRKDGDECSKLLKKGRAPNPPLNPTIDDKPNNSLESEMEMLQLTNNVSRNLMSVTDEYKSEEKDQSLSKMEQPHITIYTRNPAVNIKSNSPVIREKDKRERATVKPKFRSLNTFNINQRNQLVANSSTQELSPQKNLSMSEECLADEKKKKTKFSIRKFLRIGTTKTTDNLHKKDSIYSEVITGDEQGVIGKPRLVIIHPIDINPTAVEVVKEIKRTESTETFTGKPPAPPQKKLDQLLEQYKPARPPPPKSAELQTKQKIGFNTNATGSVKCKTDNVYANLGEIRNAIAPRKPERTASMREREANLELERKLQENENLNIISVCTPNALENTQSEANNIEKLLVNNKELQRTQQGTQNFDVIDISPKKETVINSKLKKLFETDGKIAGKLEIFERSPTLITDASKNRLSLNNGLKTSVLKINNTIDNYLKNKQNYEALRENKTNNREINLKSNYNLTTTNHQTVRSSFQDTASVSDISCTRSEYSPVRYGLNNNLTNFPRMVSASYCISDIGESNIYSPYSFLGSETGGDVASDIHESVWGISMGPKFNSKIINHLRIRKGRSVVHKSIEDNYTAVVLANHEALSQVLDQLQKNPTIPQALHSLTNAIDLRFEDFTIFDSAQPFVVGKRAFHAAHWATIPVTLVLSTDCNAISGVSGELNQLSGGIIGALNPITEFFDLVPSYHLPLMPSTEIRMLQATISVLPRMQLDTLQSIGSILKNNSQILDKHINNFRGSIPNLNGQKEQNSALKNVSSVQNISSSNESCSEKTNDAATLVRGISLNDVICREVGFIILQLVNGLKNLQAKAIEEMPLSLSNVVLCKEMDNKNAHARLCVLQGVNNDEDEPIGTLCKCAYVATTELLPITKLTPLLSKIFLQERSDSLSKAKSILEFILWGPSDISLDGSIKDRELVLQRWLDLERATVLHGLVQTRVELTIYDECHLMFLVRSNAKTMNEAAKIVSNFQENGNHN